NQKLHARRGLAAPPGLIWPMFHRDARRLGNATAVSLSPRGVASDGRFWFRVENSLPFSVLIEASSDLIHWEETICVERFSTIDLVDPDTATHAKRFFRGRVQ